MNYYQRLTTGINERGRLIPDSADVYEIINKDKEAYLSAYLYNDEHKKIFDSTGSIAGITDVKSNRLIWDFDNEIEPSLTKPSAEELIKRLIGLGIDTKDLHITFSGKKGIGVEVKLTQSLSPKQIKNIAFDLASDLPHFDTKIYNASRIIRVTASRHKDTNLYKTPLTYKQLTTLSMDEIMSLAKSPSEYNEEEFRWNSITLPEHLIKKETIKKENMIVKPLTVSDVDFSKKIKGWTNCKWALLNGLGLEPGNRHDQLLSIISTSKALNYTKEQGYYNAKNADEQAVNRNGTGDKCTKEDIWQLVESVYADSWKGGTYSCKNGETPWLTSLCKSLGEHSCKEESVDKEIRPSKFIDLTSGFKHYVKNIDKNTIHTGLPTLDKHVFLSTGANVVVVGAAGSGKSSIALEILNNTSKAGVKSVFASLDMSKTRMFEKLMYRLTGFSRQELYKTYQEDQEQQCLNKLQQEFENVYFFNKTTPTVSDIKEYILKCQEQSGEKIKLVMVDYFERVSTDLSDDTASSKKIAGELQDLVNDLDVCLITLYQPNKFALSGGPSSPIYDYTTIKGSSFLYQAPRIILSCWRPFYNPKDFSNDRYMQMAVIKNDLGELAEFTFNWEGKRGMLTELEDHQTEEFNELMAIRKQQEENKKNPFGR